MPQPFDIEKFFQETTHAIWEQKEVGRIYDAYTHNAQIHVAGQLIYSRESWMAEVLQWHTAFPDLRLFVEDLIWHSHNEGHHASMRGVLVGTHLGDGRWGAPTGKRIAQTLIVHQHIGQGRIVEEYREANEIGLLNQLGVSEFPTCEEALGEFSDEGSPAPQGEIDRLEGQLPPKKIAPNHAFEIEHFVRQAIQDVWNERRVGKIQDYAGTHYRGHGSLQGELYGTDDLQKEILALLAAFPDLRYHLDEIFWMGNVQEGFRVATRWTILGTHEGAGRFGAPTGKRVQISGLSHYRVCNGQFVEGWVESNEGTLYRTLHLPLKKLEPTPERPKKDLLA